jgi:tetratricopeptide (TPR) repeat protein
VTGEEEAERWMREGYAALEAGRLARAFEAGEQLQGLRHPAAFEILAVVHARQGELARAIAVLEEGVRAAPRVWVLWKLLGDQYSDAGRFAEGHQAYHEALLCPEADEDLIRLNVARALDREGRHVEALDSLDRIATGDHGLAFRRDVMRVGLLRQACRAEEASRLAERIEETRPEDADAELVSALLAEHGAAVWQGRHDRDEALRLVWEALEWSRGQPTALWVVREVEGKFSRANRQFRLVVEGNHLLWRKHPTTWSFTRPDACMKA